MPTNTLSHFCLAPQASCAIGNDGGIHGTINADVASSTVDPTWFNMDTGLNTIEFYSGDISGNFANAAAPIAVGGAQDNGPARSPLRYSDWPGAMAVGLGWRRVLRADRPKGHDMHAGARHRHYVWRGNGWPTICRRDANIHLGNDQGWCWTGFSRHKCELSGN